MDTQIFYPAQALSSFILRYEVIEINSQEANVGDFLFLPSLINGFLFYFYRKSPVVINSIDLTNHLVSTGTLISSINRPVKLSRMTALRAVRIIFQPGALAHMYGVSMDAFANKSIDLGAHLQPDLDELKERLALAKCTSQLLEILNGYFGRRVKQLGQQRYLLPALSKYIHQNHFQVTAEGMADHMHNCRRNFQRRLKREIGFSPKEFIDVYRFNAVLKSINENPGLRLTDVAYTFGFNDQAHFTRRFKVFAGMRPKVYKKVVKEQRLLIPTNNYNPIKGGVFLRA